MSKTISIDFSVFEKKIGVTFADKELLKQAFVHRSFLNESKASGLKHNERLEFLGDAVLELVVTDFLYHQFPDNDEGVLTAYRASLVNAVTLSSVSEKLGFNDYMLLSKGEAKDHGRARQFILADAFESVTGAIYEDQGYDAAEKFIANHVLVLLPQIVKDGHYIDAKSKFQEAAQEKTGITPQYRTIKEEGPDHDKRFTVGVFIAETQIAEGAGKSKQEAEQQAAQSALASKQWQEGK